MTDYDADYDEPDDTGPVEWVDLWVNDRNHPLTRYCLWVAALAILGWLLVRSLTP